MMIRVWTLAFLAAVFLASCGSDTMKEVDHFPAGSVEEGGLYPTLPGVYSRLNAFKKKGGSDIRLLEIGTSARRGMPIALLRFGSKDKPLKKRFLFVAGTHGDEAASTLSLIATMQNILESPLADTLRDRQIGADFIPVHNPDGFIENKRENGNGVDLNRNFGLGAVQSSPEPETTALMNLIKREAYVVSLHFHSANESKYENVVRVPLEYKKLGRKALEPSFVSSLNRLNETVISGGNAGKPEVLWHASSTMVDAPGIASDWCVSGFLKSEYDKFVKETCTASHPSLTIELCYPKQPGSPARLRQEANEMFRIVRNVLLKY